MTKKYRHIDVVFYSTLLFIFTTVAVYGQSEVAAHWRFEQIKHLHDDGLSIAAVGQPLTADERGPSEPQPYAYDDSGKGNYLQVRGSKLSSNVFSENVPTTIVNGMPNTRSLALKRGEYIVTFDRPLAYYDMRKSWKIEASLMCNLLGTEQVYLCKEGANGQLGGDVSIGFDNMQKKYFVEMMCTDGVSRRIVTGELLKQENGTMFVHKLIMIVKKTKLH